MVAFLLTFVTSSVTFLSESRSRQGRIPDAIRHTERVRCPRAVSQTSPGRLWASVAGTMIGCEVLAGLGQAGADNARLAELPAVPAVACDPFEIPAFVTRMSSPRKPGLKLDGDVPTSPGRAAVERRQASVLRNQHAAVPAARQVGASVCRRSASLFFLVRSSVRHCERSETIQSGVRAWIASSLRSSQWTRQNSHASAPRRCTDASCPAIAGADETR